MAPIEIICRQLCLGRGRDPDARVAGSTFSVSGLSMSDTIGPCGEVLMCQWRAFLPEADAMLRKLKLAGYTVMRSPAAEPAASSPHDAPSGARPV